MFRWTMVKRVNHILSYLIILIVYKISTHFWGHGMNITRSSEKNDVTDHVNDVIVITWIANVLKSYKLYDIIWAMNGLFSNNTSVYNNSFIYIYIIWFSVTLYSYYELVLSAKVRVDQEKNRVPIFPLTKGINCSRNLRFEIPNFGRDTEINQSKLLKLSRIDI